MSSSDQPPVIRIWRAAVVAGCEAAFERLTLETGIPLMRSQPGLLSVHLGRGARTIEATEYIMVSVWNSDSALRTFFGERWEEPGVLQGEAELLQSAAETSHYFQCDPLEKGTA